MPILTKTPPSLEELERRLVEEKVDVGMLRRFAQQVLGLTGKTKKPKKAHVG